MDGGDEIWHIHIQIYHISVIVDYIFLGDVNLCPAWWSSTPGEWQEVGAPQEGLFTGTPPPLLKVNHRWQQKRGSRDNQTVKEGHVHEWGKRGEQKGRPWDVEGSKRLQGRRDGSCQISPLLSTIFEPKPQFLQYHLSLCTPLDSSTTLPIQFTLIISMFSMTTMLKHGLLGSFVSV